MIRQDATLAILVGGRSTRLGEDKGLYSPYGDETLIERALRLWSGTFKETLVVTKDQVQSESYRGLVSSMGSRARIVEDGDAGYAAIAGIRSALDAAQHEDVVVAAVDQLGLRTQHFERLLEVSEGASCFEVNDDLLPLPLKLHRRDIEKTRTAPDLSLRGLCKRLGATPLTPELSEEITINANSPAQMERYFGKALVDKFGRRHQYLRLSLTESCNMSCSYCLPEGFPKWYRHKARLGLEELICILRAFRYLGFRKVRLTGGEPTLHPMCLQAVKEARRLGYEEICLTTNGTRIDNLDPWITAGLSAINISLDTLQEHRFKSLTKSKDFKTVYQTIEQAIARGLETKINTVLMRSWNLDEYEQLVDWALARPLTLRFIELMSTGLNSSFSSQERVRGDELIAHIENLGLGRSTSDARTSGPATIYESPSHKGKIGFINPYSCNFCDRCNRLRVTAQGKLRLCLFGDRDIELPIGDSRAIAAIVSRALDRKGATHHLAEGNYGNVDTFRTIGG